MKIRRASEGNATIMKENEDDDVENEEEHLELRLDPIEAVVNDEIVAKEDFSIFVAMY